MHKISTCASDVRPHSQSLWRSVTMPLAHWYQERRELSAQTCYGGPANTGGGQNVLSWTLSSFRRQAPNTDTFPDTSDEQNLVLVAIEVGEAETNTTRVSPFPQSPSAMHQ